MAEVQLPPDQIGRWNRYKIPHPQSGREVEWTRCTTLTKTLDDMTGIHKAQMRDVVLGIAAREDLYALACATDGDDGRQLGELVDKARAAARADAKSHIGTALHKFTERVDTGKPTRAPDVFGESVNAYKDALMANGLEMDVTLIERITVVPELVVAGTFDRVVRIGGRRYIGDLKTGQSLDKAWMSIAMQLGVYSRGVALWDKDRRQFDPMPEVDQRNGVVIHLPSGGTTCTLYWVDIATGWEAAKVAYKVREWRKRSDFAKPFEKRKEGEAA